MVWKVPSVDVMCEAEAIGKARLWQRGDSKAHLRVPAVERTAPSASASTASLFGSVTIREREGERAKEEEREREMS